MALKWDWFYENLPKGWNVSLTFDEYVEKLEKANKELSTRISALELEKKMLLEIAEAIIDYNKRGPWQEVPSSPEEMRKRKRVNDAFAAYYLHQLK